MNFCDQAIDISKRSTHSISHHGAILVKGNEVVSVGFNTHQYHAEVNAILKRVGKRLL